MGFNGDLYPSAGATSVLTTKGDMVDYDTERQRLGIGSTGQVLTVASTLPTWATLTTADSVLTTQGDVLYEGASGLARLGQSTDGFVLTTKGAAANPVWAAAGGVTQATQTVTLSSNFTSTSTSFVSTGLTLTLPNQTDGNSTIMAMGQWRNNDEDQGMELIFTNDDTEIDQTNMGYNGSAISSNPQMLGFFVATFATTDGSVIDMKVKTEGAGTALIASSSIGRSSIIEKSLY